ncbi:TKL/DRK protein kinase [Phytophthora cinnamomi]|uniref:TKL/DRK protein kinase n=1 Tax=Phytophthora cinnamomi TaxID=4785 RepID=UPI00355A8D32|nr:TKL/DRK protein kinase [Phytophthora cinnamomi]
MAFTFAEELSREFGGATPMLAASVEDLEESQWFIDRLYVVQIMILVEYLFLFTMCLALAIYLRRNRHIALTGDSNAARKVLLPAFAPLLWLLASFVGVYSVVMALFVTLEWLRGKFSDVLLEIFYSMRLFVFGLVMVFLLQKSVSIPALRRSVAITLILALYTLPVEILSTAYVEPSRPNLAFMIMSAARAFVLAFFAYVFVRPPARASKRTLREYCLFIFTYSALHFCMVWRVLKADTEFWRGLGQPTTSEKDWYRS